MTTAGIVFGEVNADWASSARVDSALPGSHDLASFFCTPLSLPASGPASATRITQNRTTAYFTLRLVKNVTTDSVMNVSDRRSRPPGAPPSDLQSCGCQQN